MSILKEKVKNEEKFEYKNKLTNKAIRFKPKGDEVVVTFNHGETDADGLTAISSIRDANFRSIAGNPDRQFAVLQLTSNADAQSTGKELLKRPGLINTIPVLVDPEGLTRYFMPDELTVQFTDKVSEEDAKKIIKSLGSEIVVKQRTPGYYTVSVPAGKDLFETIDSYVSNDKVEFAEPSEFGLDDALRNETLTPASTLNAADLSKLSKLRPENLQMLATNERVRADVQEAPSDADIYLPDDSEFQKLWGLRNIGQTVNGVSGTVDADIDAPLAWDYTRGHANVVVVPIDTGCDLDHPDLVANLLPRGAEDWDFADAADSVPEDSDTHGTHVAGTMAAVDNASGVIGVAPKCRIMPLRVNLTSGMNANRADAINYVASQALAHPELRYVINCSWKMSGDHTGVKNAIINAVSHNVVVCFAAGNDNNDIDTTPQYPAVYSQVIAVGATDQKDHRASFSNYGTKVDVSAPGVNIYSTIPNNTYGFKDGTSMASPHAAGAAALIWSRNRSLSNAQVRTLLENNCDNIDAKNPGFTGKLGKGRVNVYQSVKNTPIPKIEFTVIKKIPFPQANSGSSSALSFARKFQFGGQLRTVLMFLTQKAGSERIYYLNPTTGVVIGSIDPVANDTIGSIEWDGKYIQVANVTTGSGFINAINPVSGAQVASVAVPAGRGEALAIVGADYYYSTINRIHVIKRTTGAVLSSFIPPGGSAYGLAYGDGLLFSGNDSTGEITAFDPVSKIVQGTLSAPGGGTHKSQALAYDATLNRLYVANQSENTIYVLQLSL